MKTSQVIASLILVVWLAVYWIISMNGGFMTGFGPGGGGESHNAINWKQVGMDAALTIVCVIPLLALWTPSRFLLGIGAVLLLPVALLGVLMLTIPPLGLAILTTVFLWCYAARTRWSILLEADAQ
jgi:hypothetical protein